MYDYEGHTDCDSPLGVVVHQPDGSAVRLPVVHDGLQLYERKVGPTAITRRAEVTMPIEGLGDSNWTQYVSAFSAPDSEPLPREIRAQAYGQIDGNFPSEQPAPRIQTADVIGHPINGNGEPVGEPSVLFRGYIAAVGSREGTNRARFRIYDPMKFLSHIEAGVAFEEATTTDVLNYVADEYTDAQSVFPEVSVSTDGTDTRPLREIVLDDATLSDVIGLALSDETIESQFTFSTNRDTLADVVKWLQKRATARVWFQPSGERGITLVAVGDDAAEYDLTPENDTNFPYIIQNNALYEMRPYTSLKVKGKAGATIEVGDFTVNTPFGDTYPEATAVYPPLVDRFGGELVETTTATVTDTDEAERTAKKQLKQMLDEVSGGSMITTLAPMVRPFDRVTATPACAGVTADVDPLAFEVQEAVHSVVPSDDNLPRTELSVSMSVDPSLIETESTVKDTRTGEEPSETDPLEEYDWGYGPGSP